MWLFDIRAHPLAKSHKYSLPLGTIPNESLDPRQCSEWAFPGPGWYQKRHKLTIKIF